MKKLVLKEDIKVEKLPASLRISVYSYHNKIVTDKEAEDIKMGVFDSIFNFEDTEESPTVTNYTIDTKRYDKN